MFDGGLKIVDRLLLAYGYATQRELVEKIGLGQGTVSTWIRRNYFPGDVVVRCALDTGVSLQWLATGEGLPRQNEHPDRAAAQLQLMAIESHCLHDGRLTAGDSLLCAKALLPSPESDLMIIVVKNDNKNYFIKKNATKNMNGLWLLQKVDVISIEPIQRVPGDCWRIDNVDWPIEEVQLIGKVIGSIDITL